MPSIQWNKNTWPDKLANYDGVGHWGDHWGTTNKFADVCSKGYTKGKTILEIGPGAGRFTKHLLDAEKLILVDISTCFLGYCMDRFSKSNPSILYYETSDCDLSLLNSGTIDLAVANGVFMHVCKSIFVSYLEEFGRLVKPGGRVALDYWDEKEPIKKLWFEYYDKDEVAKWAENAGFDVIKNEPLVALSNTLICTKN